MENYITYFPSDFDDAVDDEDLDLIEENLGINLDRVSQTQGRIFFFFHRRGGKILGGVQVICNMQFLMLWKAQEMATKVCQGGEAKF